MRFARRCINLMFLLVYVSAAVGSAQENARAQRSAIPMQEITPALSREPLVNPGMGLYLAANTNPEDVSPDAWYYPFLDIAYFRDDWSLLQPDSEGTSHFDAYFKPIFDLWVQKLHKRVAFRFMSENMHSRSRYVTPAWVFAKGVPSVKMKGLYVSEQTDPVFWDERYLAVHERFIAELGKYLDGRPGVEFIDIGSIGEWGEMHLQRWTPEQLQQTGYTLEKYIAAYRRIIDAFARAFPHTRVFLNVGDYDTINDYAALRGLHFRQDGLNPSGPSSNVGKRFYQAYARRGVECNYELYAGYKEMKQRGWGVRETFEKGLEDPISYLHINLMGWKELASAPDEVKTAVTDAARRLGYRFIMTKLRCSKTLRLTPGAAGRLLLEQTWKNVGVAPCYASYALRWTLLNTAGTAVAEQTIYPQRPTTLWQPGEEVSLTDVMTVPAGLLAGEYRLKVVMFEPESPSIQIQLGLQNRDAEGRYELCTLPATPRKEAASSVLQSFAKGVEGWSAAPGMIVRTDRDGRNGAPCLRITGVQPGGSWNYASAGAPGGVLPGSRYRLSCWMKVDALSPAEPEPYLKIGLNDARGKWITNFNTNHYDMGRKGTWQYLTAYVETPPETGQGEFAVEKGQLDTHVTADVRLSELRFELLESP